MFLGTFAATGPFLCTCGVLVHFYAPAELLLRLEQRRLMLYSIMRTEARADAGSRISHTAEYSHSLGEDT